MPSEAWEDRLAATWASMENQGEDEFVDQIEVLVAELPAGDSAGLFELAAARDSTGRSDLAVPLYREALEVGLVGERRRRAVIQLASSLRNLHRSAESVALLSAELTAPSDLLDDAVRTVLALALTDVGREREAVAIAVEALAAHLPRYQRSMAAYARMLVPAENPLLG